MLSLDVGVVIHLLLLDRCETVTPMDTGDGLACHDDGPSEHDPDPQTAPCDVTSCIQSHLMTPVKRLLMDETSRDSFKSPRRKRYWNKYMSFVHHLTLSQSDIASVLNL